MEERKYSVDDAVYRFNRSIVLGQQLDEAVGQEKMSSDVEPGDGSVNWGRLHRRHSL